MKTLIRNGTILTAADRYVADVLVEDGVIAAVGRALAAPHDAACRVLDATGKLVLPGGIDVHTHLDMPFGGTRSTDDFATGTVAAAMGGTTTIVDFAIQERGGTLRQAVETWHGKAEGKAAIDYGFHVILSEWTAALGDEMAEMVEEGVTSFKLFTAYPGVFQINDGAIFRALLGAAEAGGLVMMHAENGPVIQALVERALARGERAPKHHALTRPALAEAEATHRTIRLAQMAGAPIYIVHLSAAEALDEVRRARAQGAEVFAETCPQYLVLSSDAYDAPGFAGAKYVMSPPLRARARQDELWRGLKHGELQVVATDHCPFDFKKDKVLGRDDFSRIPNGAPGIENRMSLLWDQGVRAGRIDEHRFVEVTATGPARLFGLFPQKGTIAPGSDADLVLFDPGREMVLSAAHHHMRVDYSLYEGMKVRGTCETVLSRGEVIVQDGRFLGEPGRGRFLRRAPRGASSSS